MRILLASAVSAALLAGCATYESPGYGYGYASPYSYDNGYYSSGYGPSYYYDPYYYEPGFYGSFSNYDYHGDGHYDHRNYGGYHGSYQGSVPRPQTSMQAGTSWERSTVRAHRDRSDSRSIAPAEERQRSVARTEQRQQARSARQSTHLASSGRVTSEPREHGG